MRSLPFTTAWVHKCRRGGLFTHAWEEGCSHMHERRAVHTCMRGGLFTHAWEAGCSHIHERWAVHTCMRGRLFTHAWEAGCSHMHERYPVHTYTRLVCVCHLMQLSFGNIYVICHSHFPVWSISDKVQPSVVISGPALVSKEGTFRTKRCMYVIPFLRHSKGIHLLSTSTPPQWRSTFLEGAWDFVTPLVHDMPSTTHQWELYKWLHTITIPTRSHVDKMHAADACMKVMQFNCVSGSLCHSRMQSYLYRLSFVPT